MEPANYAVVAYLAGELRDFVHSLRRQFDPQWASWLPHVTVLPPRNLQSSLENTIDAAKKACASFQPFSVAVDSVSSFWPVSGVVYLSISAGSDSLVRLHEILNSGDLAAPEPHHYVPHITVAQGLDENHNQEILREVRQAWSRFSGQPSFEIDGLSFVQQDAESRWVDLSSVALGMPKTPAAS
jgi:2'-5' RNA ligase